VPSVVPLSTTVASVITPSKVREAAVVMPGQLCARRVDAAEQPALVEVLGPRRLLGRLDLGHPGRGLPAGGAKPAHHDRR
jgi:hypothetical protein